MGRRVGRKAIYISEASLCRRCAPTVWDQLQDLERHDRTALVQGIAEQDCTTQLMLPSGPFLDSEDIG